MNWKVHSQAGLTSLMPLALAVLALSFFYIDRQNHDLYDNLNTLGETVTSQVAAAAAQGLSNKQQLSAIKTVIGSALTVPDVISVTIVNDEGTIVLRSLAESRDPQFNSANTTISSSLIFMRPIRINKVATTTPATHKLTDAEINTSDEHVPNIGWTIVELSPNVTQARQFETIKSGMLAALLIFSIAALLILRIMGKITKPISILSHTANEIKQGNFEVDLVTGAKGELATLESSIKDMAKALKQSRDKLESRINQATMDLLRSIHVVERQNTELKSAREQALLASKVKTEFLANMSHEIRTPMNGVLGFLKLLRKTSPSNEQLTHIDTIEKSANNLLSIINDILDISKIEAGKVELQSVRYSIRDCIETVISLLSPSAYDKQIELVYFIYNDVPATLIGDEAKLRQILTNLIGNALKFTDHGEVVVRVMVEDLIENCAMLRISVTDTGIGIDEKDQHRLFFTFEQVDSSSTRKFSGTGLGLSISKTLTELMGGKIEVESKPNIGSTFAFTFKHDIPAHQKIELNKETDAKLRIIRGVHVLVYDSNQVSQMAINHLLNNIELTTILVNNRDKLLSSASELQKKDQTLYILMSLSQHDVSSETLQDQIKLLSVEHKTRLVGVINSADPEVLLRIKNYGFDVCLSKPLHYQDVVDTFHSLVVNKLELAPVIETEAETSEVSPISQAPLLGMHILVAEDNAINAKLVDTLLSQAGAKTYVAKDGEAAITATAENQFDIILMDVHMPKLNGVEASIEIRKHDDYRRNIPIIALTADAMPEDNKIFQEAGMNAIMIKPIDEKQLISAIKHLTGNINLNHAPSHKQPALDSTTILSADNSDSPFPRAVRRPAPQYAKIRTLTSDKISNKVNANDKVEIKVDELGNELFCMLLKELPSFKNLIMCAFEDNNLEALEEHSHKLHGATCYCDVPDLKSAIQTLERAAKMREIKNMERKVGAVKHEIDLLMQSSQYG